MASAPASRARSAAVPVPREASALLPLLAITALAAVLRLWRLGHAPPGLNQDEALNAWNAWCLLKTGHDMTGTPWPIFYSHVIGDNRTTLMFYAMMPFQAVGGLGVMTARLPAALSGILCIPLVHALGARLFGRVVGLAAALLLALDPWHVFMSRWGIDGSLCPFLALLPLALLAASGLLDGEDGARPRAGIAALAGLAAGIACYGYWPMRLFIPAALVLLALAGGRAWARSIAARGGWRAALAFAAAFAATFGPLAWRHLVDPEIARRAEMTRLWEPGTPSLEIARLISQRWLEHYGPTFLFTRGDSWAVIAPAVGGALHLFMLPLLIAGLAFAILDARRALAPRFLLALLVAYPAGDLVARYDGVHSLRSSPGIGVLALLAGFGAVRAWRALAARRLPLARAVAAAFALFVVANTVRWAHAYYVTFDRRPAVAEGFAADLLAASEWLRPRLAQNDAVFCTPTGLVEPFAVMLVGLRYDPRAWFAEPRGMKVVNGWDVYHRVGKLNFMHGAEWHPALEALEKNGRRDRVLFIVRPGELGITDPLQVIRAADGTEALWITGRVL